MTISEILTDREFTTIDVTSTSCDSIQLITEDPHYIKTMIKPIESNDRCQFVLFSAPGAVGKTALAKFVAYKTKGLYWDLSKLVIGDNTFIGTIYESVGLEKIDQYIKGLSTNKTALIIDAFDEAEMISGQNALENLLSEINKKANPAGTVFLFSRTETADNISEYLRQNEILFSHYELQYFNNDQAREFIHNFLKFRHNEIKACEWNERTYSDSKDSIEICITKCFEQLSATLSNPEDKNTLLGYAPVLETIAINLLSERNLHKLANQLQEQNNLFDTVYTILVRILEREHDKVIQALRLKIEGIDVSDDFFDSFYSKEEQISRVIAFITMEEIDTNLPENCCSAENYDDLRKKCEEVLSAFTKQHPFITYNFEEKRYDFIGKAFRDYILAYAVLDPNLEFLAEEYYSRHQGIPSHVFWDQYLLNCNKTVQSHHFGYLQNSYSSKLTTGESFEIEIYGDQEKVFCQFIRSNKSTDEFRSFEEEKPFKVSVTDRGFVFNSITNLSFNVIGDNSIVHIKNSGRDTSIQNSEMHCKKINIYGNNIVFLNYGSEETELVAEEIEFKDPTFNYTIKGTAPKLSADNHETIPKLHRYFVPYSDKDDGLDIKTFIHMMRSIFIKFRTHSKDMPAKDAEFVDYVILQANPSKKKLFDWMYELGIFFREKHLYKIKLDKMKEYRISMTALNCSDQEQLKYIYDEYISFLSSK